MDVNSTSIWREGEELIPVSTTGSTGPRVRYLTREEVDAEAEAWRQERLNDPRLLRRKAFIPRVAAIKPEDDTARALLTLHAPLDDEFDVECDGCGGYESYWPCPTVILIAKRHGVFIED